MDEIGKLKTQYMTVYFIVIYLNGKNVNNLNRFSQDLVTIINSTIIQPQRQMIFRLLNIVNSRTSFVNN